MNIPNRTKSSRRPGTLALHLTTTLVIALTMCFSNSGWAKVDEAALDQILNSDHRDSAHMKRDHERRPRQTLSFFGIGPDMQVVEIWPGGAGWYTEILAPYLRDKGKLYAAHFNPDSSAKYFRDSREKFKAKLAAGTDQYERVELTTFNPPQYIEIAPPGSADAVLTFRNLHNFYMRGGGEARVLKALEAMHLALKPGGILGVVDHRLPIDRPLSEQEASGYMRQDYVVRLAKQVGFVLEASSEINANPKDSADHPKGVWTLPPTLRLGDQDREKYQAIGESDRMTLRFRKPKIQ